MVGCEVCVWEGEVADRRFPRLLGQVPWPEKQWVGFLTEMPLRLHVAEPGVPAWEAPCSAVLWAPSSSKN